MASFLIQLSARTLRLVRPANPIVLPMTRADMAHYLGLTIETVSRTISKLKAEGIIRLGAGNEISLDAEKLAEIAERWGD